MPKPFRYEIGDRVKVTLEGLQRHARSVPAHAGYTREQFAWRGILSDWRRRDVVGTVVRVFPGGTRRSDAIDVQVGEDVVHMPGWMVSKVLSNPALKWHRKQEDKALKQYKSAMTKPGKKFYEGKVAAQQDSIREEWRRKPRRKK